MLKPGFQLFFRTHYLHGLRLVLTPPTPSLRLRQIIPPNLIKGLGNGNHRLIKAFIQYKRHFRGQHLRWLEQFVRFYIQGGGKLDQGLGTLNYTTHFLPHFSHVYTFVMLTMPNVRIISQHFPQRTYLLHNSWIIIFRSLLNLNVPI